MENLDNLDPEIVRTKGILIAELERDKTPIIEACQKVQLTTNVKGSDGRYKHETEIIESSCNRINGVHCAACPFPDKKWGLGICNLATHLTIETKKGEPKKFITPITIEVARVEGNKKQINPLKLSKRRNR